jgi:hypothetical protein
MRDNKAIESYLKTHYKKIKEMFLFKNLIKEVEIVLLMEHKKI